MKTSVLNAETIGYSSDRAQPAASGLLAFARRVVTSVQRVNAERRLRHDLAQLDDAILRDIGVSRDQIDYI